MLVGIIVQLYQNNEYKLSPTSHRIDIFSYICLRKVQLFDQAVPSKSSVDTIVCDFNSDIHSSLRTGISLKLCGFMGSKINLEK